MIRTDLNCRGTRLVAGMSCGSLDPTTSKYIHAVILQAVCNVLNILLGVGLLSLPFAFKQASWAGLPILAVMGLATSYTGQQMH